jgi:hypothetical protein
MKNIESIKAKIASNEVLNQDEIDQLEDIDIDALLEYEHVARLAKATNKTIGEIKAEISAAPLPYGRHA